MPGGLIFDISFTKYDTASTFKVKKVDKTFITEAASFVVLKIFAILFLKNHEIISGIDFSGCFK